MQRPLAAAGPVSQSENNPPQIIAAVDLGSNSFHMIVGELRHGQLAVIDRIRETVRLAEGLSASGEISADARQRALDCLSRFGERLRDMRAGSVRAAGTSTIRRAHEDLGFMADAERALGHPIEIISGIEEARLVYNGVTHSLPPTDGPRLVTDIGGGSTEIILGQSSTPTALESLDMGCVSMTERYFPGGQITRASFAKARMAARLELRPVKAFFLGSPDIEAIGTSGTIRAAEKVVQALAVSDIGITLAAIEALIEKVLKFDTVSDITLPGLSERRSQVWPGGLAILAELMRALRIDDMRISDGALREGLLYDLLGRLQHEDARERTVRSMASRYQIDVEQSKRVMATAADLLAQTTESWQLGHELAGKTLGWAARLHEIGLNISHDGYQRHGAYIAEHADLPGFPKAEKRLLALLIGSQRHPLEIKRFNVLPVLWRDAGVRLVILLRLAVLLNRSRNDVELPSVTAAAKGNKLTLGFNAAWLADNPLTIADLEREKDFLEQIDYELLIDQKKGPEGP